ncbi:MAG TPA: bifunctional diguanylate cyclase/phosphodiesterase, partial [Acidimicrobiales bacterium]
GSVAHTWQARRVDGSTFPLDLSVRRVGHGEHWGYVATARDDSDRRRREQQHAHRATHDELTQLPNRVLFQDRLEQALRALQGRPSGLALLLIGVQRRNVDRVFGRIAGDRVVMEVARRVRECVRDIDTVARIGDDELAIVCQPCPGPATAGQLAARVLAHATRPLYGLPAELVPRAHIGVVTTSDPSARPDRLLAEADVALDRARTQGSPGWCVYRPMIDVRELSLLEIDLREKVTDRVVMRYQPIIDLRTGRVDAVEALARLRTHDGTLIQPAEFVPLAERNDLVRRLGEAVLEHAARDVLVLREEEGFEDLCVSVNVSPRQLSGELRDAVGRVLADTGLPANALMLEVTESAPIDTLQGAIDVLRELRALGVRVALDDIGTGYSRLDQVRDLPIDALKIDRTFVRRVAHSAIDRDIIQMVVAVGRRRGLTVVAEGIETVEQVDTLNKLGCTHVQGFLFGQPMHVDELRYVLREWHVVPPIATDPGGEGRGVRTPSPRVIPS